MPRLPKGDSRGGRRLPAFFLLQFLAVVPLLAQEITGTVTDENNVPLPGLNVVVQGTTSGTITDVDGYYSITAADPDAILMFSYIGYITREIPVAGQAVIDVQMEPMTQQLEDVVVIGYGTVKKQDLTGSVAVVTAEEISRQPIPNMSKAIQGKASGVVVYQNGTPGGGVNMRVRGIGSINMDPDPLFVVDGIVGADINGFSPEDIESVSVLKDASAGAIYGANGANGVVVITTKRGAVSGEPRVTFSASMGTNLMPRHYNVMNADQYAAFYDTIHASQGLIPPVAYSDGFREFYHEGDWHEGTDWQNEILQENMNQNYYLNIRQGNENSNYSISANYYKEEGLLLNSASDRINLRANSDFKVGKHVKVGETLSVTRKQGQTSSSSAWGMSLESSPLMDVYNEDNKEGYEGSQIPFEYINGTDTAIVLNTGDNDKFNPVGQIAIPDRRNQWDNVLAEIYLEITPLKGLSFRTSPSVNATFSENYNWTPAYDMGVRSAKEAELAHNNSRGHTLALKNQLSYARVFGRHNLNLTAVHHARRGYNRNLSGSGAGFPYEQLNVISQSLPDGRGVTGGEGEWSELSFLGRLIYSYNSRYLLTASVRRDGSSNFGPTRRWGTFPAFSLAWKLNEDFLPNIEEINMLKIRGGWGMTGNSDIGGFRYETLLASPDHFFPVFGVEQGKAYAINELWTSGNPLVKWEAAEMTNIGLDLNAFRNRVQFSAEYYIKKQTDLIMEVPISRIHGKGMVWTDAYPSLNIGDIENRGFEFDLRLQQCEGAFTYGVFANLSTVKNKVIDIPSSIIETNNITKIGHTIGSIYGFIDMGILQESDFDEEGNYLHALPASGKPSPGDLRFKDLNLDGVIDDNDRTIIGKAVPDVTYSFGAELFYKGIDFSFFFYGIGGAQIYNTMRRDIECFESQDLDHNKSADWTASYYGRQGQPSTEYLRADPSNANNNTRISTWWVDEASFLRLKDLQVGYTFPGSWTGRLRISRARIYVSGMNLVAFTPYRGYDPESPLNSSIPTTPGVDSNAWPIPRTVTGGIQLNF